MKFNIPYFIFAATALFVDASACAALPLPVPVSPPTFEIEGRTVRGEVAAWEIIGNEDERADGVVERAQSGVLRDFPSARLTLRTRQRRGSP